MREIFYSHSQGHIYSNSLYDNARVTIARRRSRAVARVTSRGSCLWKTYWAMEAMTGLWDLRPGCTDRLCSTGDRGAVGGRSNNSRFSTENDSWTI